VSKGGGGVNKGDGRFPYLGLAKRLAVDRLVGLLGEVGHDREVLKRLDSRVDDFGNLLSESKVNGIGRGNGVNVRKRRFQELNHSQGLRQRDHLVAGLERQRGNLLHLIDARRVRLLKLSPLHKVPVYIIILDFLRGQHGAHAPRGRGTPV